MTRDPCWDRLLHHPCLVRIQRRNRRTVAGTTRGGDRNLTLDAGHRRPRGWRGPPELGRADQLVDRLASRQRPRLFVDDRNALATLLQGVLPVARARNVSDLQHALPVQRSDDPRGSWAAPRPLIPSEKLRTFTEYLPPLLCTSGLRSTSTTSVDEPSGIASRCVVNSSGESMLSAQISLTYAARASSISRVMGRTSPASDTLTIRAPPNVLPNAANSFASLSRRGSRTRPSLKTTSLKRRGRGARWRH